MEVVLDFLCHADFSGLFRKTPGGVGLSAFAHHVEEMRLKNPEGTLLMDAGDEFSTNFWGGHPVVEAMNLLGTDVMTLGNHEFDHGEEILEECIAACKFPVLCANIHKRESGGPVAGTKPYVLLERQGVKIGVLGLTTEYTPFMVEKSAFLPFEVESAIEAGKRYIPEMRQKGAEVVVVLMHAPFYYAEDGTISGELYDVVKGLPPVDVCIGGHIPGDYAGVLDGTCVVKAGFGGRSLGHIRLTFDTHTREVTSRSCEVLQTDPTQEGSAEIKAYAERVIAPFEAFFSEPLARAEESWTLRLATETKLGDFIADCLRFGGQTQLAYMNATSSSGTIDPGIVTCDTITQVCGFNDPVLVGEITGKQLYQLMELVYEPERFGNNAALLISGFHAELDHTRPSPGKVLGLTLPDGTPIRPDEVYSISASAYMASGGNDTGAVGGSIRWRQTDLRFFDAAFAYAKHLGVLAVEDWPRLKEHGHPENDNSPF